MPGFKRLCHDCGIMDKKLDTTSVDLIFADNRVKPHGAKRSSNYLSPVLADPTHPPKKGSLGRSGSDLVYLAMRNRLLSI